MFQAHYVGGLFLQLLAGKVAYRLRDGLHLCGRVALTYDKVFADGSVDLCQVGNDDVAALLLLDTFCDGLNKCFCLLD